MTGVVKSLPAHGLLDADGSRGCFLEPGAADPMPFSTCDDGGSCATWRTRPDAGDPTPEVSPSQPWAGEAWLAVRDSCALRAWRYDEDQIRYHYTRSWFFEP